MWPFGRSVGSADPLLGAVAAGGARFERVVFTQNRRVMASATEGGRTLRLHESFRGAPAEVLHALGELFSSRSPGRRGAARSVVRAYLAANPSPPASSAAGSSARAKSRSSPPRAGDPAYLARLQGEFDAVNEAYFGGTLPCVPIRLSGRMRRRNGHFSIEPLEIAISRTLCSRGAEGEAERTMRHEMIHLWQWSEGRKPGHGMDFRRWARRLDIHPRATRTVCWADHSG